MAGFRESMKRACTRILGNLQSIRTFLASYFGGSDEEYDAVKHTGLCGPGCASNNSFEVIDGGLKEIMGTSYGDANLDRKFNSRDLVQVFQFGQYEDARIGNSTWRHGDWNCDTEFSSGDLVLAFQDGAYVANAVGVDILKTDFGAGIHRHDDTPVNTLVTDGRALVMENDQKAVAVSLEFAMQLNQFDLNYASERSCASTDVLFCRSFLSSFLSRRISCLKFSMSHWSGRFTRHGKILLRYRAFLQNCNFRKKSTSAPVPLQKFFADGKNYLSFDICSAQDI